MRPRGLIWPLAILLGATAARRWTDVVEVRGRSMLPTLLPGDRLLVTRLGRTRPADVVLAADPRAPRREMIKRVARIDASGIHLRGDNPAASTDTRDFGPVAAVSVEWRAVLRYWPLDRIGPIPPAPAPPQGVEPKAGG